MSGGSVAVAFQVFDAQGAPVTTLAPVLHPAKLMGRAWGTEFALASTSTPKSGTTFRYDAAKKQYVYNLNSKALAVGMYRLRIDMGHGGEMFAQIQMK